MLGSVEFIALSKLALSGRESDVRLYLAKQIRKIRKEDPKTSEELEGLLKQSPSQTRGVMRKTSFNGENPFEVGNDADNNRIPLLKQSGLTSNDGREPLLSKNVISVFEQVIKERAKSEELEKLGLKPSSSLVFEGPPGVGKTISAAWLAEKLNLPLYTLDLTAVMSSYLGKSGNNLRNVLEYAKNHPCVLFLDEIDAIAKKRSDESDVGELKRLVTIMLQEIEEWPSHGLLIAATNHPELVDPALWRRFDFVIKFPLPSLQQTQEAVEYFLGNDKDEFKNFIDVLAKSLKGCSYSDIKKEVVSLRKKRILEPETANDNLLELIIPDNDSLEQKERIEWAVKLVEDFGLTQVKAARRMRVSRDTIRKHRKRAY
ncbi:AAA family ATPase [Idiomarina sp. HP20-50]|uniref:AAA family ATPase n=1 Tax=Idiomarina sp. HP20-50 TaxID=3070813 RepID=UPI00294B4CFD|nr:AAA family ATPase [Idiomarina sp. HP20-50]MDV6316543.1 AAA family ATPase [Idiomarina sp. HP20-50]